MKKGILVILGSLVFGLVFIACDNNDGEHWNRIHRIGTQDRSYKEIVISNEYGEVAISVELAITNEGDSFSSGLNHTKPVIELKLIPRSINFLEGKDKNGDYYIFEVTLFSAEPSYNDEAVFFVDKKGVRTKVKLEIRTFDGIRYRTEELLEWQLRLKEAYYKSIPVIVKGKISTIGRGYTKYEPKFGEPYITDEAFQLYIDIDGISVQIDNFRRPE